MIVMKRHLPRRTFLRGVGAALALPLLDGMVPAFASAASSQPRRRFAVAYVPNGIQMEKWTPQGAGGVALPWTLEPLAQFQRQLTIVSGLTSRPAYPTIGEGAGDHVRAAATFLTGVHPKKTEGPDIRAGVSMDQLAARELGGDTQLRSLELCIDSNELVGACEAGYSCAYANTLSWRNDTTPLPMENQPRAVFERLFGDADDTSRSARQARIQADRSLLDSLVAEVSRLKTRLGTSDRGKLTQYLEAIRDVEQRIQRAERDDVELPAFERPTGGIPATFKEHARIMFDLQVLAFQSNLTAVSTFLMSREVSPRTYTEIGIADPHHGLSHHQNNPVAMEKLARINRFHVEQLAYFVQQLNATHDGEQTLLEQTTLLYGCGISDSNRHAHDNLPIVVIGGRPAAGLQHIVCPTDTPLTNLQVSLLGRLGVPIENLGDSSGTIDVVSGV
jgi:hypothetical protein